jgi:hypothetical protein
MKNSNNTIGNRTRDLPACTAVPQPTAQPRVPLIIKTSWLIRTKDIICIYFKLKQKLREMQIQCFSVTSRWRKYSFVLQYVTFLALF